MSRLPKISFSAFFAMILLLLFFIVALSQKEDQIADANTNGYLPILESAAPGAAGDLDTGFAPNVLQPGAVQVIAVQNDGKVLVGGQFTSIAGTARNRIARLNADGSIDPTFGNGQTGTDLRVEAIAIQPDNKIVIAGNFGSVNGVFRNYIARLNADGTLDTTFGNGLSGANNTIYAVSLQTDGKVLIGGFFTTVNGVGRNNIARLNADGTLDTSFGNGQAGAGGGVRALTLQSDGKVIIGGVFTTVNTVNRGAIARLNADGTLDTTFGNGLAGANGNVIRLALQTDGKVVIGGTFFSMVNGVPRNNIARLNSDGTLDTGFGNGQAGANDFIVAMALQSDGKVVIGGTFTTVNGSTCTRIARLNTDGTLDSGFTNGQSGANVDVIALTQQSDGKILTGGLFGLINGISRSAIGRLNTDGIVDTTFEGRAGIVGRVLAIKSGTDRKVLLGGTISIVNGVARNGIVRLNQDGTLDPTFGSGQAGISGSVGAITVQGDGKILIGGQFSTVNDVVRIGIARLNTDGTLDSAFGNGQAGIPGFVSDIKVQEDGKMIIGGSFFIVNGVFRFFVTRLNADGTLDTTFANGLSGADSGVNDIQLQCDGKILISGGFSTVNGTARGRIARLNPDGTLDSSFGNGLAGADQGVFGLALQSDGKVLVGGSFTTINGVARNRIARLNSDGTLDTSFGNGLSGIDNGVTAIALQANGKIVIGGSFHTVNGVGRNYAARLNADGTHDNSFGSGQPGPSSFVDPLILQRDGKVIYGGNFSSVNGAARTGIARLQNDVNANPVFDFDGDGKTDLSIFRPGPGEWWYQKSSDGGNAAAQFGASTDKLTPGDWTGDGKTDIAAFRPSTGFWFVLRSEDSSFYSFPFGNSTDIPTPADYDGDGKSDAAVFRPSTTTWFISKSSGCTDITTFGATGDQPVNADYDGDGKSDIAIFRPNGANGAEWWVRRSSNASVFALQFGTATDKAVPGDYTGDGKADVAFFRPSSGEWFILRSEDASFYSFPFGATGDIPAPGDYDGDGKFDPTVFRPSNSTWFKLQSTSGFEAITFGITNDIPVPSAFVR